MKAKNILYIVLFALIGGGVFYLSKNAPGHGGVEMLDANGDKVVDEEAVARKGTVAVPQRVLDVLEYIKKNNKAPEGYVGGRTFENRENRLPRNTTYQEWDVRPKVKGKNRGPERLITSKDKHAYYTKDHYRSFTKIE